MCVSLRGVAQIGHSDESSDQSVAFWWAASEKQIANQSEASKRAGGKSLIHHKQHVAIVTALSLYFRSSQLSTQHFLPVAGVCMAVTHLISFVFL